MKTHQIKTNEIRYDPSGQGFAALVAIETQVGTRRYACTIPAPITMTLAQAAVALIQEAQRRHSQSLGLFSV